MKTHKIGRFNLLEENVCKLNCDCGWNIKIGGKDKKDLEKIKKSLQEITSRDCNHPEGVCKDCK